MAVDNVSFKGLVTSVNSAKGTFRTVRSSESLDQKYLGKLLGISLEDVVDVQRVELPKEGVFGFSPDMFKLQLKDGAVAFAQKGIVNFDRQVQLPNGATIDNCWSLVSPSNPETKDVIKQIFNSFKRMSKGINN